MSKNEKNAPKRRFKEFENAEAWEQRKLHKIADFSKGRGYSKNDLVEDGTPIILYGRLYTKYQTVISEVDTFVEGNNGSVYSTGIEVVVPASGETAEDIARATAVVKSGILLGGDLNIIYPNDDLSPIFLALSISNGKQRKELSKRAQGKSVVHLHNSDLKEVPILFPSKKEQITISSFFTAIDNLVTLHKCKLEKMKALKKAYLTDMFPAEGGLKPKLRFAGFTDDWEQHKLGKLYSFQYGQFNNNPSNGGKYPVFGANGIIGGYTEYNSENSVIIGHMGEYAGSVLWGEGKHFVTYNGTIARSNENELESKFGYYMLYRLDIRKTCGGSGLPFLSYDMLEKMDGIFPKDKKEQECISKFLVHLDKIIIIHQRKLEKLQNIKKAYLNEMFI